MRGKHKDDQQVSDLSKVRAHGWQRPARSKREGGSDAVIQTNNACLSGASGLTGMTDTKRINKCVMKVLKKKTHCVIKGSIKSV